MGDELENSYGLFQPDLNTLGGGVNTVDGGYLDFNAKAPLQMSAFSKGVAGLQTLGNLMGAWNGYQQTKIAKQQLAFQKDSFNKQYGAQKNLTNSQLEDRQRRRVMESSDNMSVADYMNKYGIK